MMSKRCLAALGFVLCMATGAHAQAVDNIFQVHAVPSLKGGDAIVVSYTGASAPNVSSMCVNVYAFSASTGAMLDCCSCRVPADAMATIPIISDILEKPKVKPKLVVLKLIASSGTQFACNPSTPGTGSDTLATGMLAWKGGIPFTPATLSAGELANTLTQCSGIHGDANICAACIPPVS
jgi:hypothetical protein